MALGSQSIQRRFVVRSDTEPGGTFPGQIWTDTDGNGGSNTTRSIRANSQWEIDRSIGTGDPDTDASHVAVDGSEWVDTSGAQPVTKVYDATGSAWITVSNTQADSQGDTGYITDGQAGQNHWDNSTGTQTEIDSSGIEDLTNAVTVGGTNLDNLVGEIVGVRFYLSVVEGTIDRVGYDDNAGNRTWLGAVTPDQFNEYTIDSDFGVANWVVEWTTNSNNNDHDLFAIEIQPLVTKLPAHTHTLS